MYRLIIVDDEEIICRGLSELMEWAKMGYELVTTLRDGREAIEFLKKESIDVVLTDIKMKDISGLEVAKYVRENIPQTRVVIISGYREFDYAKKAVEYNVVHYLLKPTQFDEVEQVFSQIKQELDKERETESEMSMFKDMYREVMPILQEQLFIDLLMGALRDKKEISERISKLDINIDPYNDKCFLISFNMDKYKKYLNEQWNYGRDRLDIALKNFFITLKEEIKFCNLLNYEGEIKVVVVYSHYSDNNHIDEDMNKQLERLSKSIKSVLGLELELRLEQYFKNIFELANYKSSFRLNMLETESSSKLSLEPDEYKHLINKYKLFMSIIYDGDVKAVSSLADSFITEMQIFPLKVIHHMIIDMFAVLTNQFMEMGTDILAVTSGKVNYQHLISIMSLDAIKKWCKNVFVDMIEHINKNKNETSDNIIAKALEYIEHNYNKDISLDDVADRVFLNPVYFSRLFKQQMGINFTDCLTKIRMEKAIELLKEKRYKTYEVSERVGYSNCKYFTRVFKQFTGYTTTEYLKLVSEWGS